MNGAQLLVQCLEQHGVTTIFGMPGGQTTSIYDALHGHPTIRHILVRNEHAGAMMADGYARATGRPGVCLVTAGPGLTNCLTGLGTAYSDSIPILVLSGQVPRKAIGVWPGYYHEMDNLGVTSPLTKWNASAACADEIPELVQRAFGEMCSGRPRPVHLDLPIDMLVEKTEARPLAPIKAGTSTVDQQSVQQAANELASAKRPLIIAGGGVVTADASRELLAVAETLGAPVLTTPMGKGCVPDDHPLAAGMLFHRITSDLTNMKGNLSPLPDQADAVLAVGCRFSQVATGNWALELPRNLVQIDIDAREIGRHYPAKVGIQADAKAALAGMMEVLGKTTSQFDSSSWRHGNTQLATPSRWHIEGLDIVPILRRALNRDAIFACDVTRLYYMMLANLPAYEPRTFLHSSGFIALGYGLPAALGAQAAFPDRQVVAIAGDGGFLMTAQELACAVQHKLNVITVLVNDNCLSAMKGIQNRSYAGRHIAVDLVNPDFVRFAESFGALGLRVDSVDRFEVALRESLNAKCPAVIEIQAPETAM
jgi:acetolactate synthase-1/2/3 large subunit